MLKQLLLISAFVLLTATISSAQSAREDIKADSALQAQGLPPTVLDEVLDSVTSDIEIQELARAKRDARARILVLIKENPGLRQRLLNER